MNQYVSLLRGINVSGQKKIQMADLKVLYQSLGFTKVTTYIQSGNVIFTSPQTDSSVLQQMIEQAINDQYHFSVPVTLCPSDAFSVILADVPFKNINLAEDGSKVLITFLSNIPSNEKISTLFEYVIAPEQLIICGNIVYLYCPKGYGKSKLSNVFLERKLKVLATTRNLKSIVKLNSLMQAEQ
jgi:uncharacterized protein (DUF1697 family)